jgi:APA family basic amino acid/polyamine antiporter
MINVGTMIGSAIFIVPAVVAGATGSPLLSVAVWVMGGLISLLGALSVAELSAAMPEAGGQYVYLSRAYGPAWGFLYGWAAFVLINPASIAAISVAFATYLSFFTSLSETGVLIAAVSSTVCLTSLNCLGLKPGAWTQNILTLLKIGALLLLPFFSVILPGGTAGNLLPVLPGTFPPDYIGSIALALIAVLWAYDGWIEITYIAGEVKNPQRTLPMSIVSSMVIVILLYALVALACVYVIGVPAMAASELVASDVATVLLGPVGAACVAGAIMVSTLGSNNGIVFTAARIPYAMARKNLLPLSFAKVHPRFRTPAVSLTVQGGIACALTVSGTYVQLYTYVVFASWLFYAMSCMAVIVLRKKMPGLVRPYKTIGYPWVPAAAVLCSLVLLMSTVLEDPVSSLIGVVLIGAGVPFYFQRKKTKDVLTDEADERSGTLPVPPLDE